MFNNICRRGPASISRVIGVTTPILRIPSTRPSSLYLLSPAPSSPAIETRWIHISSRLRNQAAEARSNHQPFENPANEQGAPELITQFEDLSKYKLVHPNVIKEITKAMKLHTMTDVQTLTINQALRGDDIAAQARTGTGKTIGFLLPTIQNILRANPELVKRQTHTRARASDIKAIIISPTRELAEQIAAEAEKLVYSTDLRVQVATGGNSKSAMLMKTRREGCHLLVATPGRLNDLLTDEYSGVRAPGLTTLVLDEADRLLDSGFSADIQAIIDLLPDVRVQDRQTLLFSATMPRDVMHLVRDTLKPGFHFIQTVKEGELATHEKVPQKIVATPGIENFMPALLELSKRELAAAAQAASKGEPCAPFKAIVYFQSTANVELSYEIFNNLRGGSGGRTFGQHLLHPAEVSHIHGQLTQQQRTRVADRFRKAKSGILFSTDVTARGMDFPNVTHVIQIGLASNKEQYIHRLGRTGRADKAGEGWLMVTEDEVPAARRLFGRLPIVPDKTLEAAAVDMTKDAHLPVQLAETLSQIGEATRVVPRKTKVEAYKAALSQLKFSRQSVGSLNQWTRYGWGFEQPPTISPVTASRLGHPRSSGLNIGIDLDTERDIGRGGASDSRRGGGFGGRGGGFGGRGGGFGGRGGGFGGSRGERPPNRWQGRGRTGTGGSGGRQDDFRPSF